MIQMWFHFNTKSGPLCRCISGLHNLRVPLEWFCLLKSSLAAPGELVLVAFSDDMIM